MRDRSLDGTSLSADDAFIIAAGIGRLWKRFRRRSLDPEFRDALATALLHVRLLLTPSGDVSAAAEIDSSRYDIKNVAALLRSIAVPSQQAHHHHLLPPP